MAMDMTDMEETITTPKSTTEGDARFYLIVSLLLGVMVAVLAWMWWSQRSQRVTAQRTVIQQKVMLQQAQMASQFRGMLPQFGNEKPSATKLDRQATATVTLPFKGEDHPVIIISPKQGTDLGLLSGDLLWVSPSSPRQPAQPE
jgi:hypothetical protein